MKKTDKLIEMIKKVVCRKKLSDSSLVNQDLLYWLSRTPEERIAAVDYLRMQLNGNSTRLQRVVRVTKQAQS